MKLLEFFETINEDASYSDEVEPTYPNPLPSLSGDDPRFGELFDRAEEAIYTVVNRLDFSAKGIQGAQDAVIRRYAKTVDIPIANLTCTEVNLYEDHLQRLIRGEGKKELPLISKMGDVFLVNDGNHRVVAEHLKGNATVRVKLLDIDALEEEFGVVSESIVDEIKGYEFDDEESNAEGTVDLFKGHGKKLKPFGRLPSGIRMVYVPSITSVKHKGNKDIFFIPKGKRSTVGMATVAFPEKGVVMVEYIMIAPEAQGMGIGLEFYEYWLNQGYRIHSDEEQSTKAKALWLKLVDEYETVVLRRANQEIARTPLTSYAEFESLYDGSYLTSLELLPKLRTTPLTEASPFGLYGHDRGRFEEGDCDLYALALSDHFGFILAGLWTRHSNGVKYLIHYWAQTPDRKRMFDHTGEITLNDIRDRWGHGFIEEVSHDTLDCGELSPELSKNIARDFVNKYPEFVDEQHRYLTEGILDSLPPGARKLATGLAMMSVLSGAAHGHESELEHPPKHPDFHRSESLADRLLALADIIGADNPTRYGQWVSNLYDVYQNNPWKFKRMFGVDYEKFLAKARQLTAPEMAQYMKDVARSFHPTKITEANNTTLYHGTLKDHIPTIQRDGIQPQVGSFIRKVYPKAKISPLVYAAEKQDKGKVFSSIRNAVADKLGKTKYEVSKDEFIEHGAVAVIQHDAEKMEQCTRDRKPYRSVEKWDYYCSQPVHPDSFLTGDEMVEFFGVILLDKNPTPPKAVRLGNVTEAKRRQPAMVVKDVFHAAPKNTKFAKLSVRNNMLFFSKKPRTMEFGNRVFVGDVWFDDPFTFTEDEIYNMESMLSPDLAKKVVIDWLGASSWEEIENDPMDPLEGHDLHDFITDSMTGDEGFWQHPIIVAAIKEAGHDGVISQDPFGGSWEYVIFDDKQFISKGEFTNEAIASTSSKFPMVHFPEVYHVGDMDPKKKRGGSHEGSGLSVSLHPEEWTKIARLGGNETNTLQNDSSVFLDFHKLADEQKKTILAWGVKNEYITPATIWRVSWYDDEMEDTVGMEFDNPEDAAAEAEGVEGEVEVLQGKHVSTPKMKQRIQGDASSVMLMDLLSTIFVEDVLEWDGVWWEDVLRPEQFSAPRGVIVPSAMKRWTIDRTGLSEGAAIRTYDPGVLEWLQEALSRPDADDLYLHGSRQVQDVFSPEDKRHEHALIHFSKLTDPRFRDIPFQAEYYGPKLLLCKLNYNKPFDVRYPNREAARMHRELVPHEVSQYRLDYGDIYHIIEPALAKGYDIFVVWEVAASTESYAVPDANQVQVIDTYDSKEKV